MKTFLLAGQQMAVLDHGLALCRIARDQNGIELDQKVKLYRHAVLLKGKIYQKIVHRKISLHITYKIKF
jgi:hypothetical protein